MNICKLQNLRHVGAGGGVSDARERGQRFGARRVLPVPRLLGRGRDRRRRGSARGVQRARRSAAAQVLEYFDRPPVRRRERRLGEDRPDQLR